MAFPPDSTWDVSDSERNDHVLFIISSTARHLSLTLCDMRFSLVTILIVLLWTFINLSLFIQPVFVTCQAGAVSVARDRAVSEGIV